MRGEEYYRRIWTDAVHNREVVTESSDGGFCGRKLTFNPQLLNLTY